jgi:hypothetical protein
MGSATSRLGGFGNKSSKGTGKNRLCPLAGVQQNALCLPNLQFEISIQRISHDLPLLLYYLLRSASFAFTEITGRQLDLNTSRAVIIVTAAQPLTSCSLLPHHKISIWLHFSRVSDGLTAQ